MIIDNEMMRLNTLALGGDALRCGVVFGVHILARQATLKAQVAAY
jgi:hypothetical protein